MSLRAKNRSHEQIAFLILAGIIVYLFWQIIHPYALVLLTAGIAAIVFAPLHTHLTTLLRHRKIAAFFIVLGVGVLLVVPLFIAMIIVVKQAGDLVDFSLRNTEWLTTFDLTQTFPIIGTLPPIVQESIQKLDFRELTVSAAQWALTKSADFLSQAVRLAMNTVIFFIALFYFLADRERIHKELIALSPLRDTVDENIVDRLVATVRSSVFGAVVIAFVQGILATIGMTLFGVPGAALWGAAAVIASQVPMLGTGAVMAPAVFYLFLTGHTGMGIGLLIWSVCVIGTVDNILAPFVVKGASQMHALLVLISILGGITVFGPIGFIVGPVLLAAFLVLVELYKAGFLEKRN